MISYYLNNSIKSVAISVASYFVLANVAIQPLHAQSLVSFDKWEQKNFVGKSNISFSEDNNLPLVEISSDKTSSGLFLKKEIDLNKTPVINWSWKTSNVLRSLKERSKKGDDFSARIYVLTSTGPFPWQKKTISYVWSNYQKIGSQWPNPYTSKVIMVAVDSGAEKVGTWQHHKRNVQKDLETAFGEKFDQIDVIAIMTDTDNSKQQATGWYKDIHFSKQ
jgi:hypothetical protein